MIEKKYGDDFYSYAGSLTLPIAYVTDDIDHVFSGDTYSKTHSSGWTITGIIASDYYYWVASFEALHPKYGKVYGDFEKIVYSDSEQGFQHFYKNHPPKVWDKRDI